MSTSPTPTAATSRRAAAASFVGGVVESYDVFIHGTAAALVLDRLFSPTVDPAVGTLLALVTFGVAYVVRPLSGVLFGHIGDRVGRRASLVGTLVLMGASTFLIGCLPTYAVVGPWAALGLVLLRLAQGLAAGGELGGASALAVEHTPPGRRGCFGAFATPGTSGGVVLGSAVFALVTLLPDEQFHSWGWRVPFLLSALVVLVGVLVRRRIPEPEVFREVPLARSTRLPVRDVLRLQPRAVAIGIAVFSARIIASYLVSVYSLTYAATLDVDRPSLVLTSLTVVGVLNIFSMLAWRALSDRFGRRPVLVVGVLAQGSPPPGSSWTGGPTGWPAPTPPAVSVRGPPSPSGGPNGTAFLEAVAATWKLGAVPQPVSHHLAAGELAAILDLVRPDLVVGLGGSESVPEGSRPTRGCPTQRCPSSSHRPGRPPPRGAARAGRRSSSPASPAWWRWSATPTCSANHRAPSR